MFMFWSVPFRHRSAWL